MNEAEGLATGEGRPMNRAGVRLILIASTIAVGYFLLGVGVTLAIVVRTPWSIPFLLASTGVAAIGVFVGARTR